LSQANMSIKNRILIKANNSIVLILTLTQVKTENRLVTISCKFLSRQQGN